MRYLTSERKSFTGALLTILFICGCTPLIGAYSPTAYKYATSLKAETLAIMDKATEQYSKHEDAIGKIIVDLRKAHEYVKGLPRNSISAKQWEILIDPDGDLMGKFFKRWEQAGTKNQTFIDEFKSIVSDAFDEIICLEANKKSASKCSKSEGE